MGWEGQQHSSGCVGVRWEGQQHSSGCVGVGWEGQQHSSGCVGWDGRVSSTVVDVWGGMGGSAAQ